MPVFKDDNEYKSFINFLADLSLDGENFEICLAALKLQSALMEFYGNPL